MVPNCKELHILQQSELTTDYSEPYKLCTFSRVMKEKGIEPAVEAVKKFNEEKRQTVLTLDIFGQVDEGQRGWFEQLQNSLPNYISYRGQVPFDKSTEVLKEYYALLFPTHYEGEGFAGTLIDAMAAGVPVVASDWKYNSEIVIEGETGTLIKQSLLDSLRFITTQKKLWLGMKRLCLKHATNYLPEVALKPVIDNLM